MLKVMRCATIPRHFTVFDYMSLGDLFYMVLKGKVLCKVPFYKQCVHLNGLEADLFKQQFKDDLIDICEARSLNAQLDNAKSKSAAAKIL